MSCAPSLRLDPEPRPLVGRREPIAIVGAGLRFPGGAHDMESYWRVLRDGVDAVTEVPADRWSVARHFDARPERPGKTTSRWGGFVRQSIELFDAPFFGMSPREASYLDPMQRWLLEVSWEALEDAGIVADDLAGSDTAVFIGGFTEDIKLLQMAPANRAIIGSHAATGSAMTMLANRLSYFYDLRGPSLALDTACSSSLVAVHLACESLWSGESSLALVGGANAMFRPEYTIAESKAGMLSPDGRCKTFDARANGYVRGEGAAILVLKPLSRARADGDRIRALVRATGINQDGRTNGITVPSGRAQEALVREVCARAGVSPGSIGYVEAHGTGTPVGDPIEANALGAVLREGRRPGDACRIGSVKTNFGHLEAAAGVAGLLKAVLCLEQRRIPPHLHLENLNPAIAFDPLEMRVPRALEAWPEGPKRRLASVNSFGFGGTNAHVILEEAPELEDAAPWSGADGPSLLTLSARSEPALLAIAARLADAVSAARPSDPRRALRDLCHSAAVRRVHHDHRIALRVDRWENLGATLEALARGEPVAGLARGRRSRAAPRLAFVFGGMGPQWWAMGRELFEHEPVFREAVVACDVALGKYASFSLIGEMRADESRSRMPETQIAQPASFALQYGLTALLRAWGIQPDAVVGHSAGEVAAAACAGVFTLDEAARIIFHRSRLQQRTTGQGRLVAVGLGYEQVRAAIGSLGDRISVAAVNGPSSVTLVGDGATLETFVAPLEASGVFVRFLRVDVPYHSHYMAPLEGELLASLDGLRPEPARVPLYSTVTGARSSGREWDAAYFWRNVRDSVLFAPAIEQMADDGCDTFLEIGAHPVLGNSIQESFAARQREVRVFASLRRGQDERATLLDALGGLYVAGVPVDWKAVHGAGRRYVPMPTYPWQRDRHWVESAESERDRVGPLGPPLLGERVDCAQPTWEATVDLARLPFLRDHVVGGAVVYPGAAYVDSMLAAARALYAPVGAFAELRDVAFQRALFLSPEGGPRVHTVCDAERGEVTISSAAREPAASPFVLHASGTIAATASEGPPRREPLPEWRSRFDSPIAVDDAYRFLARLGLHYGPAFRGLAELRRGPQGILARVRLPDGVAAGAGDHRLHPCLLDACFQALLLATAPENVDDAGGRTVLPTGLARLRLLRSAPPSLWVRAELTRFDEREMVGHILACDDDGQVVLEVEGVAAQSLEAQAARGLDARDLMYEVTWESPAGAPSGTGVTAVAGSWLVLADAGGPGDAIATRLEARGHRCVRVRTGSRFAVEDGGRTLTVDPLEPADFDRLLDVVLGAKERWLGVLHLWGLDVSPLETTTATDLDRAQARGPIAILHLVQAMDRRSEREVPRIWAVTRGVHSPDGEPTRAVAEAAIWAMMRVVAYQEHADRFGGLVDLDPATPEGDLDALVDDLTSNRLGEPAAYRHGERLVPRLVARPELASPGPTFTVRPDASILVTGGLGGLGVFVSRWLVAHGARRLVLVGRTPVPARSDWPAFDADSPDGRRIAAIKALEAEGASVHTPAFDVADEAALRSFLDDYRREGWPPIRGVIHAAGVSQPNLMTNLTRERMLATARPKLAGAWWLHRHFEREPLDFFVLFSSVAAFGFTAGQADYAAANAAIDALARHRRARGLPASTINWGPWAEAGMATLLGDYFEDRGLWSIAPATGLKALEHVLRSRAVQATVLGISDAVTFARRNFASGLPVPFIARLLERQSTEEGPDAQRESGDMLEAIFEIEDADQRRERLAQLLQALVARVLRLGAAQVDIRAPLGELGLDSLLAVELKSRIAEELRTSVPIVDLLRGVAIETLAARVHESLLASADPRSRSNAKDEAADGRLDPAADEPAEGPVPLAPNQLWFLARDLPNPDHWNVAAFWESTEPLDPTHLRGALEAVLRHHDALRLRVVRRAEGWAQELAPPRSIVPFRAVDLGGQSEGEQDRAIERVVLETQTGLDLASGPVVQIVYFDLGPSRRPRLLTVVHHLVCDVFSQQIVLADLQIAYRALARGESVQLPPKTAPFQTWVERLVAHARSDEGRREAAGFMPPRTAPAPLPVDLLGGRERNTIASARVFTAWLTVDETQALFRDLPRRHRAQVLEALLAAFSEALAAWTGGDRALLDMIVHGRELPSGEIDLARTVGLFAHGVPFSLKLPAAPLATRSLPFVQEQLATFGRFARCYAAARWLDPESDASRAWASLPRRELIFNYIGQFEPADAGDALLHAMPDVPRALEDPANLRDFLLQCQVGVLGRRLTVLWHYSENVHLEDTIRRLSDAFLGALRAFLEREPAERTAGAANGVTEARDAR